MEIVTTTAHIEALDWNVPCAVYDVEPIAYPCGEPEFNDYKKNRDDAINALRLLFEAHNDCFITDEALRYFRFHADAVYAKGRIPHPLISG